MSQARGFSNNIIRIYFYGASVLLAFYLFAFHAGILMTENSLIEKRINIVAPHHFQQFVTTEKNIIAIDPLLTIYREHRLLPAHIQSKVQPTWTGAAQLMLDDDQEFQLLAQQLELDGQQHIVYAVEWDDTRFILTEVALGLIGVLLFLITTGYMIRAARRIASPFLQVAEQLEREKISQFNTISPVGEETRELSQIVAALNRYRVRIKKQIEREQSFTRYVSHELRTPMMIIRGALSNLRRAASQGEATSSASSSNKSSVKAIDKITLATKQMEELTHTFLLLAREEDLDAKTTTIDDNYMLQLSKDLAHSIQANEIEYRWQLHRSFELKANPQLCKAVIHNLLKNAFACSVGGKVSLLINEQTIEVIDNGVGLDAKPRGYEGFGIGLVLVQDICDKYGWQFSLHNNETQGCCAKILMHID